MTEIKKQYETKRQPNESISEESKKSFPGFPEPIDESEAGVFAKMREEQQRLLSKTEKQIGDTLYTVYSCVPENCSDEQFQQSCKKRVERLIMSDLDHQLLEERDKKKER